MKVGTTMSRKKTRAITAIEQANSLLNNSKTDPSSVLQDSGVFFLAWFSYLLTLDPPDFIVATIAVLSNVFYGVEISEWDLPVTTQRALETFVPTIKKNRSNRMNGPKGGNSGYMGPEKKKEKNPGGVTRPDPGGVETLTPNDTDMGTESGTEAASYDVDADETGYVTAVELDKYQYLLPVFFFMNFQSPWHQLEKFVKYYSSRHWMMKGGDTATTSSERIALAKSWKDKDDLRHREKPEDLEMWHSLYQLSPDPIKAKMLHKYVRFGKDREIALITCPESVIKWIKTTPEAQAVLDEWRSGLHLQFKTTESLEK